jgi:hypothetical protein
METTHAVGRLINGVKSVNGWSDEFIARRARDRGHDLSKSNVARIRTEPVVTVGAELVMTLADGLNLPPQRVIEAYMEAMGFPYKERTVTSEAAISSDGRLSSDDRDALLALLRFMVRRRRKTEGYANLEAGEEVRHETTLHGRTSPTEQPTEQPTGRDYVQFGDAPGQLVGGLDDEQQDDPEVRPVRGSTE